MKIKGQGVALDDLDWQILQLLQENAKSTYTEIGNKLDVAHSTVYDRVQRMEEHGFIKKYEAVVDPEKAGIRQITAFGLLPYRHLFLFSILFPFIYPLSCVMRMC